jgi:hypothetical protein
MEEAAQKRFPNHYGEATPRWVGVHAGKAAWKERFVPYFNFSRTQPIIKAFCYINWNWTEYQQFADWGDARIEANDTILALYQGELRQQWYHADPPTSGDLSSTKPD